MLEKWEFSTRMLSTGPGSFKLPVAGCNRSTLNALPASHQRLIMVDILLDDKLFSCSCDTGTATAKFAKKHIMRIQ